MRNIILIGFMGAGKSSVGRLLARRLGRRFVDLDCLIEQAAGLSIPEIFARYGEAGFRAREKAAVARAARLHNAVIATGGGVVLDPDNIRMLQRSGVLVWLTAKPETILERTSRNAGRPLLRCDDPGSRIRQLLTEREPLYQVADYTVDTNLATPQQVVEQIMAQLKEGR